MSYLYDTNVHIFQGLPGSGKTTLAKKMYNKLVEEKEDCVYVSLDAQEDYEVLQSFPEYGHHSHVHPTYLLDGWFKNTKMFIDKLAKFDSEKGWSLPAIFSPYTDEIVIHYFIPNEELCIKNDIGRREKDSVATIKAGIEKINIEDLYKKLKSKHMAFNTKKIPVRIEEHIVEDYSAIPNNDEVIYSPWITTGSMRRTDEEFEALDIYLEKNYPECSFLKYKKIQKFVKCNEKESVDYYDTHMTCSLQFSIKVSDIKKVMED